MKIAFLGNTCNNSYSFIKSFADFGLDGHLYFDETWHPQTFPISEDKDLIKNNDYSIFPYGHTEKGLRPWISPSKNFLEKISQYDVIHCEDIALIWAQLTKKPYHWHVYGYDLHKYPFFSFWLLSYKINTLFQHSEYLASAIRYRRAISNANSINIGQWFPFRKKSIEMIKNISSNNRISHLFFPIDTNLFLPQKKITIDNLFDSNKIKIKPHGLLIFHPTRIMYTDKNEYHYASDTFASILKKLSETGRDFTLIVVRKGNPDEAPFEQLLRDYKLHHRVAWIPFQPRADLIPWYCACDLTTNEFGFGSIGSISLETMSCGTPLMTAYRTEYPDPNFFLPDFDSHPPIFSANSEDEALKNLIIAHDNPELRKQKGREGREWVLRNCSGEALYPKFMRIYQRAIKNHPVPTFRPHYPEPDPLKLRVIGLHLKNNDFQGALAELAYALDDNPEHPLLLGTLVNLFRGIGASPLARSLLRQLEELEIEVTGC